MIQIAPPHLVNLIMSYQIAFQEHIDDLPIWKHTGDGVFTCSSAWELIRIKRDKAPINVMTRTKYIPFKCSFHLWRSLRGKLPINEKLTSFGQ